MSEFENPGIYRIVSSWDYNVPVKDDGESLESLIEAAARLNLGTLEITKLKGRVISGRLVRLAG